MKKCCLIIGLCLSSLCSIHAQSTLKFIVDKEGKLFAIPSETNYEIKIPEATYKSYTSVSEQNRRLQEKYAEAYRQYTSFNRVEYIFTDYSYLQEADRPANMNVLSEAYRPFFNPYTPMLWRINPMALDYDEWYIKPVAFNTAVLVNGRQETWPALGGINIASMAVSHRAGSFTVTTGGFAGRYYTPYTPHPSYWGGVNATARYELTDWMAMRAWGSYAFYGDNKADPFMVANPWMNRTNVGGSMEFKVSDDFGFGIGVNYQHNHFNNRMEPQFMFYPFGNAGSRFRLGF